MNYEDKRVNFLPLDQAHVWGFGGGVSTHIWPGYSRSGLTDKMLISSAW